MHAHPISREPAGRSPISREAEGIVWFPIFDFRDCCDFTIKGVFRGNRVSGPSLSDADFDRARVINAYPGAGKAGSEFHQFVFLPNVEAERHVCLARIVPERSEEKHDS